MDAYADDEEIFDNAEGQEEEKEQYEEIFSHNPAGPFYTVYFRGDNPTEATSMEMVVDTFRQMGTAMGLDVQITTADLRVVTINTKAFMTVTARDCAAISLETPVKYGVHRKKPFQSVAMMDPLSGIPHDAVKRIGALGGFPPGLPLHDVMVEAWDILSQVGCKAHVRLQSHFFMSEEVAGNETLRYQGINLFARKADAATATAQINEAQTKNQGGLRKYLATHTVVFGEERVALHNNIKLRMTIWKAEAISASGDEQSRTLMFRAEIEILDVYEKCMALLPAPATMRSKARHGQSGHLVFLVYSTLEEATQVLLNKVITLEGCDYKVFAARESSQEQKRNKAIAVASFREAEDTLRYQQQLKAADPMVVDTEISNLQSKLRRPAVAGAAFIFQSRPQQQVAPRAPMQQDMAVAATPPRPNSKRPRVSTPQGSSSSGSSSK